MLSSIKLMLGIAADDNDQNERLQQIISDTTAQLTNRLGGISPPESLDYIIRGVSISRYNKIGSEGLKSHSVEGESLQFADSDFDAYTDDIKAFLESQNESNRGRLRFL